KNWRESVYYRYWMHLNGHHIPGHFGVRTDRYKLIFYYGLALGATGAVDKQTQAGWELYDLQKDPQEVSNVYKNPEYSDISAKLKIELIRLKEEFGDSDKPYPDLKKVIEESWN
ncbi:MAG: DUF4976 domain-containing protein, partial [Opitutales bacterium]|nr:DUF4976 domain-containing protein [Opitutales bacterium]